MADRERLLSRYRELVLHELPRRAQDEGWVVTADHCIGRIVLDHADPVLRRLDAQILAWRGSSSGRRPDGLR